MIVEQARELRKLWSGFWSARVLITANNLGVFDLLDKPRSAEAVAKELKTDGRATALLLDALAGIGLIEKKRGKYRNTAVAGKLLLKGSPYYQGDIIRHADSLWQSWSALDEVVKTGRPARRGRDHRSFILGMHNIAVLKSREVMRATGLRGVKAALDLGGGPGTYSMEMAGRGVRVTLFDLPDTVKIARRVTRGIKGIRFKGGDFMHDDFGRGYDLILISQIFHAYPPEENLEVLGKCLVALNPGGRVAVHEFNISEDRTRPQHSALFSINMLVNTAGGRCYSPEEIKGWLLEAGFRAVRGKSLGDTVLVMGRK
jgi:2-polyprenyl-3-methyl-5-hydroxy-6-metoxy-1,4-benzoquinol methylase